MRPITHVPESSPNSPSVFILTRQAFETLRYKNCIHDITSICISNHTYWSGESGTFATRRCSGLLEQAIQRRGYEKKYGATVATSKKIRSNIDSYTRRLSFIYIWGWCCTISPINQQLIPIRASSLTKEGYCEISMRLGAVQYKATRY